MIVTTKKPGSFRTVTKTPNGKTNAKVALAAAVGAMGLLLSGRSNQAVAQSTFYFDPNLSKSQTDGGTAGSNNWDLVTADWYNNTTDVVWPDTNGTTTIADFADAGDTANLAHTLGALGLVFGGTGDTISGSSTLTLGVDGINAGSLGSGTTTISAPLVLAGNQIWNIGTGSNLSVTSVINGGTSGFTEIGGGTIKLTKAETATSTGTTTLEDGTLLLNYAASGAGTAASNILAATSSLTLGGGTLQLASSTSNTNTQTFAGTTLASGASAVSITNTGSKIPLLALGPITIAGTSAQGQAVVLTGLTSATGSTTAVGTLTIGTINGTALTTSTSTPNGTLVSAGTGNVLNNGIAGADFATVGQYDFAALDPTRTFIEGGSAITGFYTPFSSNNSSLAGNADVSGNITNDTSAGGDTVASIRFNSTSATTLTMRSVVHTGGILVTPNLGANNVNINSNAGVAGELTPRDNGSLATEMIVYQNNTLGFLNLNTGIGQTTVSGGAYTQVGPGTVVLGSATTTSNTYTGQTYLEGGYTVIAADLDIGGGSSISDPTLNLLGGTLMASATFGLDNGGTSPRPVVVGTQGGALAASGTNTLTVDGAVTGTGALQIGVGTIAGSGTGTANTTAVTGVKGTVILSGGALNTYSGGTTINTGTLEIDSPTSSTGSGNVTITSGGYLIGTGKIGTNVVAQASGHIDPGDNNVGTLTMAALQLNKNSILDYDFTPTQNDLINITNTNGLVLNVTSGNTASINVNMAGTTTPFDTAGTYDIFQINGGTSYSAATLNTDLKVANAVSPSIASYSFGVSGNDITLTITSLNVNATWNNTGSGNWSDGANDQNATDPNWTGGIAPGTTGAGDVATFGPPTSGGGTGINSPSTVDLNTSETIGTIIFNNSNSYTISSAEGSVLTLNSGSTGPALITDNLGTHTIAVPVALTSSANITVVNPTDTLLISGALSGTTAITINPAPGNGAGTVILADPGGNAGYSGQPTVNSGTLQIGNGGATGGFGAFAGTMTVNGTLSYDLSGTVTLANKIAGTGTLQQSGTGILNVDHADTMSFTNITNGTLQLGVAGALGSSSVNIASPGTLDLNGKSPTLNALSGNGTINNVAAGGNATLTIGTTGVSTNNNTFNGSIQNTTGTVSLVQAGTGTLTLNGASTYSGGTSINAGAIKAGNNSAFGTGTITIAASVINALQLANGVNISNPIVANTGTNVNPFEDVPDPGASATISGNITTTKAVRFGTSQTNSTLTLTGNDTVGAATTDTALARGNLVFAGNNTFVNNGGASPLVVGRFSNSASLNATIQDNAVVTSDSGVELGGNNEAANNTTDDASVVLTLTGNGTLNTGPGLMDLNNSNRAVSTATLNLNGTSTLATSGFSLLSSSGDATTFNLNGGIIVANGSDPVGGFFPNLSAAALNGTSLNVNVLAGGGTINNNGFSITVGQALQDGGGSSSDTMTFLGTGGTTTLTNGGNSYLGNTTVGDGIHPTTLVVSNASGSATGAGNVILNSGTLASGATGIISGNVIAGTAAHTIAPGGVGTVGSLTIGGLTSTNLTTLNFDLGTGSGEITNGDLLTLGSGTVSIGSGTLMTFGGSAAVGNDYRLIGDLSSGTVVDAIPLTNFSLPSAPVGETYSLSNSVDAGYIDLVVASSGPVSLTWNNAGAGAPSDGQTWDISNNNNWNNGSAATVYTDGSNVTFNDANNAVSNGGTNPNAYNVTLNTTVAPASIVVNNSLGNYTITGTGTIGGTGSLTKSGTGILTLATPNTYSGGTNVTAGLLLIEPTSSTTSALPAGALSISGTGIVQLAANVTQGSQSANAPVTPPTSNVNLTSLSITGNGTLDIVNNHIIINYGSGPDPIDSIAALIADGAYGSGNTVTWTGTGITSSAAAANPNYGIGYADALDPGDPAGLASGQIELVYTLLGDANLDGKVNGTDFNLMATNFNQAVTAGWDEGDFNYDGKVNGNDFVLLAANFNQFASQSAISSADVAALNSFAAANGISLNSVPEPASMGLLTLGVVGALARRRRKA